jgi:cellulose synthase/poly-beta-1,6-N-acetylglucosamine synthase-like glycosyltransferase
MDAHPVEELELSVVVPVRDGAAFLNHSLAALRASDLPSRAWELIVVDDGSRDGSGTIAEQYADRVLRHVPPGEGPPSARNRGAAATRAPIVVFVDADVCVHRTALRRIRDTLAALPGVDAVFGAYDLAPAAPGLVSQYRNLLHSYVHRRDAGRAITFWTGLGAVRRTVFEACGGFDPGERLDDIEFGYRMASRGHYIVLDPEIEGRHLKRWTLGSIITTDVMCRGIPWVRLLLEGRHPKGHSTLSVRGLERVLTTLMGVALALAGVGLVQGDPRWLWGTGAALLGMVALDGKLLRWLGRERGWWFALSATPLRLLYFALNIAAVGMALLPVSWRRRGMSRPMALAPAAGRDPVRIAADVEPAGAGLEPTAFQGGAAERSQAV